MIVKFLVPLVISLVVTLVVAVILVLTDTAKPVAAAEGGLDFDSYLERSGSDAPAPPTQTTPMRDGYDLAYRRFDGPVGAPLLVFWLTT